MVSMESTVMSAEIERESTRPTPHGGQGRCEEEAAGWTETECGLVLLEAARGLFVFAALVAVIDVANGSRHVYKAPSAIMVHG